MSFLAAYEATLPPLTFCEKVKREFHCSVNRYVVSMLFAISFAVVGCCYFQNPEIFYPCCGISLLLSTLFSSYFLKTTTTSGGICGSSGII